MPSFHSLTLGLLVFPPLLILLYLSVSFPSPPDSLYIHPSLASLPATCRSWKIYPEDYYSGGEYVALPHGKVRYWLLGPAEGKKVTLIHGLSIPSMIWKDVAPQLVAHGFRVLLFDLYGRGYSDAPQTTYDSSLYTTQLALLMQHLKWDKTEVVGVSMGGAVAASFVASFPHLVSSHVVLIASAGIIENEDLSRTTKVMSSPIVQTLGGWGIRKYMQRLTNIKSLEHAVHPEGIVSNPMGEIVRLQSAHLPHFNAAVASSLRSGPVRGLSHHFSSEEWARNGPATADPKRVLFIHGTNDTTVPVRYTPKMHALLPEGCREQAKVLTIEGAGHGVINTHASTVGPAIIAFLLNETPPPKAQ